MSKKRHDEGSVLYQLKTQWGAEIDRLKKVVALPKNTNLSIHMCGKIDYLEHYCGWVVMFKKR